MANNQDRSGDEPGLDELLPLKEAAKLSGLSQSHLRLLAGRGEIWAKKLGGMWFTTKQAVSDYVAQDHKPGPKPKDES